MASPPIIDASRWQQRIATVTTSLKETIRINYIDCHSPTSTKYLGVVLLIHGFPQTSYQFRHVITPLSNAGYRVIAPDYRGAGHSSKPASGYEKRQMAEDIHVLIQSHLKITEKIHVIGHDIGGMIAFSYARHFGDDVASLVWGECPLPGTSVYEAVKTSPDAFHFTFHRIPDLPEALIAGREREYLKHFFDKQQYNSAGILPTDLDHYTLMYSQPGAMRAALEVYRAFENDAKENRDFLEASGKLDVPSLVMMGERFLLASHTERMIEELHNSGEALIVEESGHYMAEENPDGFVKGVLDFISKHHR